MAKKRPPRPAALSEDPEGFVRSAPEPYVYDPEGGPFNPRGTGRVPYPQVPPAPPTPPTPPSGPTGGDGGGAPAYDPYAAMRDFYAQQDAIRQRNAIAVIRAMLDQYNLGSLYEKIVEYVKEGYDAQTVMVLIRTTPEYKQRFPAMEALAKKGRAISEGTYIEYERGAAALEQRYALPKGMLTGNVTKLLELEVSAVELDDRVKLASAASLQAPQDLRDTLSQYYGIGQGGMTAYFLDPEVAMPLLERQYATAQIGTEALRQDVGLDVGIATQLQEIGVTQEQARAGFAQVAGQRAFQSGRGETISEEGLIRGNLARQESAMQQIERISRSRTGAFEGGGGEFASDQRTRSGLLSASR